jgi:hypothetical protein
MASTVARESVEARARGQQARHSDSKEGAIMAQALIWAGRVLRPACTGYLIHPFKKLIDYHCQCAYFGLFSCEEMQFK